MQVAIAKRSFRDDSHCGDECAYWQVEDGIVLCVVDGLGHGTHAERAAKAAVTYVAEHLFDSLLAIFAGCDEALRSTRGVAMGIAIIHDRTGTLSYVGVGNTRAMIVREGPCGVAANMLTLSSNYGIVGAGYRKLTPETMPLSSGDLVLLYTDGIPESVDLSGYECPLRVDLPRLAERVLQDWGRGTDDAAILIFRSSEA